MAQSSHQDSIARHEVDILQERTAKFLGKARVLLDSLQFPKQVLVDLQRHNVDRLKRVFELEGCRRLEPDRHIPALIDAKDLQSALEYTATDHVTSETLLDNPDALPPLLKLPSHLSIQCLRGKHRVTAAKETSVLEATDRWWIVDLYSAGRSMSLPAVRGLTCIDLGAEGQRELVEQYCNSHNFTDGSVYIRILRYQASRQELAEKQWWARLTKSKRNILKRFLRHPRLASGFAKLCKFEALLVHGFRIGTLLEIMSSRLDEEILCYLNHISAIWSAIIGGDSEHRHALDSQTVASLQSKAPGVYSSEYSALRQDIEQGTIFSLLKRSKNQAKILQNIITIMYPIPTLVTLRKDLRYLDACARAVRQAVLGPMAQLQSSFSEAVQKYFTNVNQKDGYFCLQLRDSSVIYCKSSASYGPFETGYRQLHLYAMRNILHLNSSLPRQHRRCAKQRRK
ncbi:hypothetical protein EJ05DRAFT_446384 [Pseudovirgaria hyperparasitica]|uniref:Uncharacterized protein n=1 Tax=Pseudovirgaria hyperparasitica TaxID=470096 RepID=A0A6A6VPX9_9PEZI|nr:uncharacterized protein EJ05DRAFT_446384 [Pseudovirgaria hyperparasitica]KAF2752682.1 hypothetical protein EJ05DRAFT_446384 [Pseudovirgaria hyperparasitica]